MILIHHCVPKTSFPWVVTHGVEWVTVPTTHTASHPRPLRYATHGSSLGSATCPSLRSWTPVSWKQGLSRGTGLWSPIDRTTLQNPHNRLWVLGLLIPWRFAIRGPLPELYDIGTLLCPENRGYSRGIDPMGSKGGNSAYNPHWLTSVLGLWVGPLALVLAVQLNITAGSNSSNTAVTANFTLQ